MHPIARLDNTERYLVVPDDVDDADDLGPSTPGRVFDATTEILYPWQGALQIVRTDGWAVFDPTVSAYDFDRAFANAERLQDEALSAEFDISDLPA